MPLTASAGVSSPQSSFINVHMQSFKSGHTTVFVSPIPERQKLTRRQNERATVREMLDTIFPGAKIDHDSDDRPFLTGIDNPPFISISHSRAYAAIAIDSTRRIGVDIEDEGRNGQLDKLARRFIGEDEQSMITTEFTLLHAWTAKESAYKATDDQNGLTVPALRLDGYTLEFFNVPGSLVCVAWKSRKMRVKSRKSNDEESDLSDLSD